MVRTSSIFALAALLATSAHAQTAGTDAFGNLVTGSRVDASVPTNLFFDISGSAPVLVTGDDLLAGDVPISFAFPFYGTGYSKLTFSTNGFISTDPGNAARRDLPNLTSLPNVPVRGQGARIYVNHDDTEAIVYGAYYAAADNPLQADAFIAQWDACHYNCVPGSDLTVQYNAFLLTDGTVVMAHNLAGPETGSGATVGLQNETFTDGYAYFADTADALLDGDTIVILPPDSSLGDDLTVMAGEYRALAASFLAGGVSEHIGHALAGGDMGGMRVSSKGTSPIPVWLNVGYGTSQTAAGINPLTSTGLHVQAGVDLLGSGDFTGGLGLAVTTGGASTGAASVDATTTAVFAYGGMALGDFTFAGTLTYGATNYSNFSVPFLSGITAEGKGFSGAVSASGQFDFGNGWSATPTITVMAGKEQISDWATAGGALTRPTEDVSFVKAEATSKLWSPTAISGLNARWYVEAGLDYQRTFGATGTGLYTPDYDDTQLSGILGAGLSGSLGNGTPFTARVAATGIGTPGIGVAGSVSFDF